MSLYERMGVRPFRPQVEVIDLTHKNLEIEEFDRLDVAANVLIERMQKLDSSGIDAGLGEKIRREYDQKLKEAERRLSAKRKSLTRKLRDLEDTKSLLERQRTDLGIDVRELEVRHDIGEYGTPLFELYRDEKTSELEFLARKLEVVEANVEFYRRALAREKDSVPCSACGFLNQVWERSCRECGAEMEIQEEDDREFGFGVPGAEVSAGDSLTESAQPLLEQTLIRDLEAVDGAIAQLESAPSLDGRPCLVRIQGPNPGERFEFEGGELLIGKAPENQMSIPADPALSRRHAKIVLEEAGAILYDLGSTNGTAVNGGPIESSPLQDKDEIAMGSSIYRFSA